jgi:molybdate transport system substrate-binding protein
VLRHAGLWTGIESRLVFGENAAQAMQFAASGSSQGGIVPLSLSKAPEVARLGPICAAYPPSGMPTSPCASAWCCCAEPARRHARSIDYLQQPAARDILLRNGFVLPDDGAR